METFTKIVFFVCGIFYLGTTTVLAITPAGDNFLFITNQTCSGDLECDVCKNITMSNGNTNGNSTGSRNSNGYGNSNGYENANSYGYGYTNTGNSPAPSAPVDLGGKCTPFGRYRTMCIFCSLTGIYETNCPKGYCACAPTAYNSENCGTDACGTSYQLLVSELGSCAM